MKAESKRQTRDRMTQAAANGAVVRRATPTALSSEFVDISGGKRRGEERLERVVGVGGAKGLTVGLWFWRFGLRIKGGMCDEVVVEGKT